MARKKRILVGPSVTDPAILQSLMLRLAHYLSHVDVERIRIAVSPEFAATKPERFLADPSPPAGIDRATVARVRAISDKVSLRVVNDAGSLSDVAEFLVMWDATALDREPWRTFARRYRLNRTRFVVDWQRTRSDGTWFAELAHVLSRDSRVFDKQEADRFRQRTEHLVGAAAAALVATGPSAREALDVDLADHVRIVCNTAILDDELMAHVQPHIVTFADPIFHFGPSTYAHQFQRALSRAGARRDFTVVVPERYAVLLRNSLPQMADRIVGVRLGLPDWPRHFDLLQQFAVKQYPNVMTMMMLPLGATFSRRIELFGFDGRDPGERYFWRHGSTVQFDRELVEIRSAHPGFFNLDYEDYYDAHVSALEQMLLDLEVRGVEIRPRTSSHMLPLARRRLELPERRRDRPSGAARIVSISGDWTGNFGHFGPWERAVGAAARARGYSYYSLASKALQPSDSIVPTFSHGTMSRELADQDLFQRELRSGLDATGCDSQTIVCCYVGDVWQLPPLLKTACERPLTTFIVNLMRSHPTISVGLGESDPPVAAQLLMQCLEIAQRTNVHVCLDTTAIVEDLARLTGIRLPVWPMVGLTDRQLLQDAGRDLPKYPAQIIAPVQPQEVKGLPELTALAERLTDQLIGGSVSLTTRLAPQPHGMPRAMASLIDRFQLAGGRLIAEHLSDQEYARMIGQSHLVVLPYHRSVFRTRTSGVVLDAIAAGKPIVTVRDTWAGDLVDQLRIGQTYLDGNVDDLEDAVYEVLDDLQRYADQVDRHRARVLGHFAPARLVSFLADLAAARNPPPDPDRCAALRSFAALAGRVHWRADIDRAHARMTDLVRNDDAMRGRDDLFDQIDVLRSGNAWLRSEIDRLTGVTRGRTDVPPPLSAPAPVLGRSEMDGRAARRPGLDVRLDANVYERGTGAHLDELELVARVIRPNRRPESVMIDVGAHHGSAYRRFREAGWTILAFEPDPRHAEFLEARVVDDDKVVLDRRAVSNVTGQRVKFFVSEESTGISGLSAFRDSHVPIGEVETVALSDVPGLSRVDLLKIDTEGYEMFVLEGFPWERIRPGVIVAEFEDSKSTGLGYTTADLVRFLRMRDYQVWVSEWHPIIRYGITHQWRRLFDSADDEPDPRSWGNLIAFAEPRSNETLGRHLAQALTFQTDIADVDPVVS